MKTTKKKVFFFPVLSTCCSKCNFSVLDNNHKETEHRNDIKQILNYYCCQKKTH